MIRIVSSLFLSIIRSIREDPEIKRFVTRHPFFFSFLKKRLTRDEALGLSLTIGSLCASLFVFFFFVIIRKLFQENALIEVDINTISLIQLLHAQSIDGYLFIAALLGSRDIIFAAIIVVTIFLAFARLRMNLIVLMTAIGISSLGSFLIRDIFEKVRPALATPSLQDGMTTITQGHAFITFSFYSVCAYFLFQHSKRVYQKILIVCTTCFLLLSIGLGRVYYELEWPSDVVASLASTATLLTILATILTVHSKSSPRRPKTEFRLTVFLQCWAIVLLTTWVGFIVLVYTKHPPIAKAAGSESVQQIAYSDIPGQLFRTLPRESETLFGTPTEPINLIIVAKEDALLTALTKAKWKQSDPITIGNLWRVLFALITNTPYTHAPGVPTFWNSQINTFSYQKSTAKSSVRERHHLHIWRTTLVTEKGESIWFCTAHFDVGIKLNSKIVIPTHSIDPAIDKEREIIHTDLLGTGYVKEEQMFPIVEPTLGRNTTGDTFFTDGKAEVLFLE